MALMKLSGAKRGQDEGIPFLSLGFRPFFLGASLFAAATIALWMAVYVFGHSLSLANLSPSQWHAHEMIYGYCMAVIAGFLLTAVKNWTGLQTPRGIPLAGLFVLWTAARVLCAFGTRFPVAAGLLDLSFMLLLTAAVLYPIIRTRQWKQMAIAAKLVLLTVGQIVFYLGVWGRLEQGVYWGLYGGFFLVIGLIMTMGARVIPSFIRNGVGQEVSSPKWIGPASLSLYLMFFLVELFLPRESLIAPVSGGLFVITTIRLVCWHTPRLWTRTLLWSLFLSFAFIDLGFLLFAARPFLGYPRFIPLHSMAVGGIGLVTVGMMARVALGHSGRMLEDAPKTLPFVCGALALGALVRMGLTVMDAGHYVTWVAVSQALWIAGFLLFAASYAPIFIGPDLEPPPLR